MKVSWLNGLFVAVLTLWLTAPAYGFDPVAYGPPERLSIVSAGQHHDFQVEVARTIAQHGNGLMFRRDLPGDTAMLFDFQPPKVVQMWMKNTLIPLDMLWISQEGRVVFIEQNVQPGDLTPRGPMMPVRGVLELPAGTVERLKVAMGDLIEHPLFRLSSP